MHNDKLGFLGTCPSNIGTGLRGGVMICLPKLNEDPAFLEKVCEAFDLQPRGSAGEHSAAVGAKWDISNKQRIGFSEVQLVQKMIDGITKIIAIEEKLAGGATAADIEASLGGSKGGKNPAFDSGGVASGDPKDSEDFQYLTYAECPKWNTDESDKLYHKSLMAKTCTPELFAKLKDVTTDTGYTFSNAIQTGTETPHLGVGITAGDEDCYVKYADIINPVIAGWHGGYDPATMKHPTDLEPNNLKFTDEQKENFNKYVASTRIRAARNIRGKPLPPGSTRETAAEVETILKTTFEGLEGDLKGTYYPLSGMSEATRDDLLSQGFLFQKPKTTNLLT